MKMRKEVAKALGDIFNSPDRHAADTLLKKKVTKYSKNAPKTRTWMEENLPESLTVFALPEIQRKRMRTSNMPERVNKELKRRTRVVSLFPNVASQLRLASALWVDIDESWSTTKSYLNMDEAGSSPLPPPRMRACAEFTEQMLPCRSVRCSTRCWL